MVWLMSKVGSSRVAVVTGVGRRRSIGSAIVFRDKWGAEQGRQKLTSVTPTRVEYRKRNRGPRGKDMTPEVDFRLEDLGGRQTRVHMDFRAAVPLPPGLCQLAELVMGRRVRALPRTDRQHLKTHVESSARRNA